MDLLDIGTKMKGKKRGFYWV